MKNCDISSLKMKPINPPAESSYLPISVSLWFLIISPSSKWPDITATWLKKNKTITAHKCISLLNEVYLIFITPTRSLAHLLSVLHLLNGSKNSGHRTSDSIKRDNAQPYDHSAHNYHAHTQPSPGKGSVHCCFWSLFLLPCRAKFVHSFPSTNRIRISTLHVAPVKCWRNYTLNV